jgi:hypothetical protein
MVRALEHDQPGFDNFVIANADTVMSRPSTELMDDFSPGTEYRSPVEGTESLCSIDKARRVLGWEPQHSWRDANSGSKRVDDGAPHLRRSPSEAVSPHGDELITVIIYLDDRTARLEDVELDRRLFSKVATLGTPPAPGMAARWTTASRPVWTRSIPDKASTTCP